MNILALIPARGGSKGVPRKNVKLLAGKPLIVWTIDAALKASGLTRVVVSTDDPEIAETSRRYGAEVPFLRPAELASDKASSVDVTMHAVAWLEDNQRYRPDFILLLQPTSPLRTASDIEAAIAVQRNKKAQAVVSVCKVTHPPQWLRRLGPDGELLPWQDGIEPSWRQDADPVYQLNGAIYLIRTEALVNKKSFFPDGTFAYIMPHERSLDIDTSWDFYLAELILKDQHGSGN